MHDISEASCVNQLSASPWPLSVELSSALVIIAQLMADEPSCAIEAGSDVCSGSSSEAATW